MRQVMESFEIESNGTLKSLVSLDRETVATLPITVRATDPNGNFTEEDFFGNRIGRWPGGYRLVMDFWTQWNTRREVTPFQR